MARYGYPRVMGAHTRRHWAGAGMATRDPAFLLNAGAMQFLPYPGRHVRICLWPLQPYRIRIFTISLFCRMLLRSGFGF